MSMSVAKCSMRAVVAGVIVLAATRAVAVDRTFSVNNGNMSIAGNWSPSGVPAAGDTGIIEGVATSMTAVFSAALPGPPDAIVVRSNGTIRLNVSMTEEQHLVLEGGRLTAGANWTYGSSISLRYPSELGVAGTPIMAVTGLIQDAGSEAGMLIISSTGSGYLSFNRPGGNTYSGGTLVATGRLVVLQSDATGLGPVEVRPGAVLQYGANLGLRSRVVLNGGVLLVAANYTLTSTNALKGDGEIRSDAGSITAALGGLIEDFDSAQTGRLVKTGTGVLNLTCRTNTYSGGTLVREGILTVPQGYERALGRGDVVVSNGAELRLYAVLEPTWPGYEIAVLSNALVRLQGNSALFSSNVVVRDGGTVAGHHVAGNYGSYDRVRIEGRVRLLRYAFATSYNYWYGTFRDGASPGRLVWSGTGTGQTYVAGANLYTGGTEIEDGGPIAAPLKLFGNGRMPDVGTILIHTNGVMDFNGIRDMVGGLAGVGTVQLGGATVTNSQEISPGTNSTDAGTLTVGGAGRIVLGAGSTNTFHLRTPVDRDQVVFTGAAGLTLGGVLKVEAMSFIRNGDYTLFDLNGGAVSGSFSRVEMPPRYRGVLSTNSGDVVLTVTGKDAGTTVQFR